VAVAELVNGIEAPAESSARGIQRACISVANGDLGERFAGQRAAHIHGYRNGGASGAVVAELPVSIVAPAVGGTGAPQRARIVVPGRDPGKGHAGQHAAGVHGYRSPGEVDRGSVAKIATSLIAPAVSAAAVDGARVTISSRN